MLSKVLNLKSTIDLTFSPSSAGLSREAIIGIVIGGIVFTIAGYTIFITIGVRGVQKRSKPLVFIGAIFTLGVIGLIVALITTLMWSTEIHESEILDLERQKLEIEKQKLELEKEKSKQ